jgi:hypothetical protein
MLRWSKVVTVVALTAWVGLATHQVWAYPSVARTTKAACAACHTSVAGGVELSDAGKAYKADATKLPTGDVKGAEYIGSNKCKMCHIKEYKAWSETKHAHAFENLAAAKPEDVKAMAEKLKVEIAGSADKTDGCVSCHVTGFQLAGGYPAADDSTKTANLAMVGCEGCHGPGSIHASKDTPKEEKKKFINAGVTENMCKNCHTPEMSPKFDFAEYKKTGVHIVAAAAAPATPAK